MRSTLSARKGAVLIMALLMSTLVFMLAVSYSSIVTIESKTIQFNNDANMALYIADAGMQKAFTELVNMGTANLTALIAAPYDPGISYVDTILIYGNRSGRFTAVIHGHPEPPTAAGGDFGLIQPVASDPSPSLDRGRYRWRFTITSEGQITVDAAVQARRSLIAKVLIERSEDPDDYQGFGKIENWTEQNR